MKLKKSFTRSECLEILQKWLPFSEIHYGEHDRVYTKNDKIFINFSDTETILKEAGFMAVQCLKSSSGILHTLMYSIHTEKELSMYYQRISKNSEWMKREEDFLSNFIF